MKHCKRILTRWDYLSSGLLWRNQRAVGRSIHGGDSFVVLAVVLEELLQTPLVATKEFKQEDQIKTFHTSTKKLRRVLSVEPSW